MRMSKMVVPLLWYWLCPSSALMFVFKLAVVWSRLREIRVEFKVAVVLMKITVGGEDWNTARKTWR